MAFIRIPKPWHLPENRITSESAYFNRRRFLKTLTGASIGLSATALTGCQTAQGSDDNPLVGLVNLSATANPDFVEGDRPITGRELASTYNNFYEFGGTKNIWRAAQNLPTDPWTVEVSGLIKNPKTYDLDDLTRTFDLEERVHRFRCVEAWSMVVPWIGFPMRKLLEAAEPTAEAKFVRFTSYYDESITTGPGGFRTQSLPWPYIEGLRIDEMANDLAFFAVGMYGQTLPKQNGAPIRMVVPWKYGFKGGKSIVKIEFIAEQPATYWNTLIPNEYKFESNVEPDVPHPRWSQAQEKLLGPGPDFSVELVPTLPYNGYGDHVAQLYI
ncbi:MAG: protein-methionine-sulfoxide reductase catalytic subunit MsrP [Cyanothece sp. SIO2G6]|nr:protein-methionine-sulfoxide reductase catalytic subunit MsrP [Cyanothece sp. SIO2G6]